MNVIIESESLPLRVEVINVLIWNKRLKRVMQILYNVITPG